MAENEFQTTDNFDETQLEAVNNTPPEIKERQDAFNQERDAILGVEKPEETPWQLTREEFEKIVEKANKFDQDRKSVV